MKVLHVALATLGIVSLVAAWDCDRRCPAYEECMDGNRRVLEPDLALLEDGLSETGKPLDTYTFPAHSTSFAASAAKSNLRGSYDDTTHRDLQAVNFTYAQFKMYWMEGYCWQEEWDEREWCLECPGSDCDEDDILGIQQCSSGDAEQRFVYEPVPGTGGGRLKPYQDTDLCWERTDVNRHRLKECSSLSNLDTNQIIIGIQENGRFEMHPYGWDENTTDSNGPKCLNVHHHPKDDEVVRAEYCSIGRPSKNTRWILINKVLETSGSGGSGGTGGGEGDPEVFVGGGSYCTASSPCPQCHGDCDTDADCQGGLVCFERDGGDPVPSCRGGEDSPSDTDYCIDPNWVAGGADATDAPTVPPTSAAPVLTPAPTGTPVSTTIAPTQPEPTTTAPVSTPPPTTPPTQPAPTTAAPASTPTSAGGLPAVEAMGGSFCTPTNPCPMCYGDCDVDDDCQGSLVCEERDGGQPVSGCSEGESSPSDTDYCVDPNSQSGTMVPSTSPPTTAMPSSSPPTTAMPSSYPPNTASPVLSRTDSPPLSFSMTCSPTTPCDKCVGDCDTNDDCIGALVCFERDGGELVPGCSGSDPSKIDYCVDP